MKNIFLALQEWLSHRASVPSLFALYMLPRILVLFVPVTPTSDAAWYFNRAVEIVDGAGYAENGVLTAFWPPGWPLTIGALFKIFGVSLLAIQVFNLCCAAAIAWLSYDLGRRLFESELAGRATLLLLAIYPNHIAYVPLVFTELYYTTLLLAGCWFLIRKGSVTDLVCGGVIFGVATLVKAQTLTLLPFIYGVALLRNLSLKNLVATTSRAVVVGAMALAVVLPWSFRNQQVFGTFIMVSTNGGLTLLTGNNPSADGTYGDSDPLVTSIVRTVATQVEVDAEARRRAIEWIKQNPGSFVALLPRKFYHLWIRDGEGEWWYQAGYKNYDAHVTLFRSIRILNQLYYFGLLAGFCAAAVIFVVRMVRRREARIDWWALPYALALNMTGISLVFSGQSRFHYCFIPFVAAACGWVIAVAIPSRYALVSNVEAAVAGSDS